MRNQIIAFIISFLKYFAFELITTLWVFFFYTYKRLKTIHMAVYLNNVILFQQKLFEAANFSQNRTKNILGLA